MRRRSFVGFLLAIPVVKAVAKYLPVVPPSVPYDPLLGTGSSFIEDWNTVSWRDIRTPLGTKYSYPYYRNGLDTIITNVRAEK